MFWKLWKKKPRKNNIKTTIISIDKYDDLFSDFDPRPYNVRAVSTDFISELERADQQLVYDKYHVIFVTPKEQRAPKEELVIKKRISEFFNLEYLVYKARQKRLINQGALFISLGVIVIFLFFYLLPRYEELLNAISFFQIIFELLGWFLLWEGLNLIIFDAKEKKKQIRFFKLASEARLMFVTAKENKNKKK